MSTLSFSQQCLLKPGTSTTPMPGVYEGIENLAPETDYSKHGGRLLAITILLEVQFRGHEVVIRYPNESSKFTIISLVPCHSKCAYPLSTSLSWVRPPLNAPSHPPLLPSVVFAGCGFVSMGFEPTFRSPFATSYWGGASSAVSPP